jgi:hypothetical protein
MNNSPFTNLTPEMWKNKTLELINIHPINPNEMYEIVQKVWSDIFKSGIGSKPFNIGVDLFPRPQIMAYLLHELIPLELAYRYPELWRREETVDEKDLVYIPDPNYSIEIKCSSSKNNIFGNRSYTQETLKYKKSKSGYYLAINFQGFKINNKPEIKLIRFGWLDHSDWIGQTAASGQQAHLAPQIADGKLIKLPL